MNPTSNGVLKSDINSKIDQVLNGSYEFQKSLRSNLKGIFSTFLMTSSIPIALEHKTSANDEGFNHMRTINICEI